MNNNELSEEELRKLFISVWDDTSKNLICEVPVFCRSIDLVVYDEINSMVSAIEFKKHNWKRAVEQLLSISIAFDYLEICVIKPKMQKTLDSIIKYCSNIGIGIYFFDIERAVFEHINFPIRTSRIWEIQKKQVIDYIREGDNNVK